MAADAFKADSSVAGSRVAGFRIPDSWITEPGQVTSDVSGFCAPVVLPRRRWLQAAAAAAGAAWLPQREARAANGLLALQIGPLAQPAAPEATQLGEGMRAAFNWANARGGVQGRPVEFLQLDDGGDPDRFEQCFHEALARKPLALLSPGGFGSVQRLLKNRLLDGADIVVLNAVPGAEDFRNPGHPRLFHLRAGDARQIERIVRHISVLGVHRLGVLYQDAPGGRAGLGVATDVAGRAASGLALLPAKAGNDAAAIATAARTLADADLPSALVIGPPPFMADAVAALRAAGFRQSIFGMSYLAPALLMKVAGAGAHGVGLSQVFPNPMGVVLPLQREFQAAMRAAFPQQTNYSAFQLEGYLSARLFLEVARRMKRGGAEDFAATLRAAGEMDFGGFWLDFSRGNSGSRFVEIGIVRADGRLAY